MFPASANLPTKPEEGSVWTFIGGVWKPAGVSELSSVFTLPENTSATEVTGAEFSLAKYRGGEMSYVITRGSGICRKGVLQIAGDASSPSVSDSATSVGAAGITWSVATTADLVKVKIATDNSVAVPIRLRFVLSKWSEP
jgi:hypothetical protein